MHRIILWPLVAVTGLAIVAWYLYRYTRAWVLDGRECAK